MLKVKTCLSTFARRKDLEQNPETAAELVGSKVDVIVAWTTPSVVAARRAT